LEASIFWWSFIDRLFLFPQVGDINVQTLISYTSFNDESGESPDRLVTFKRWLWATVEKMTPLERQDLVYFWTGTTERGPIFTDVFYE